MQRWRDITIGDLIDGLRRYQPFLATVVAIVLIATVLPGRDSGDDGDQVAASGPVTDVPTDVQDTATGDDTTSTVAAGPSGGGTVSGAPQASADGGASPGAGAFGGQGGGGGGSGGGEIVPGANCDPKTKRIKVPSVYAPPCAPKFEGNNGGATSKGVSEDAVKVAIYIGELDPATGPILSAAGAADDPDEVWAIYQGYGDYFNTHYETYGRKLELIRIDGGQPDDDTKAKQNAEQIKQAGAFIAVDGPTDTNVYVRELARAGIICVCTTSQPIEIYLELAPYVWSTLMSSTQLYVHRAEYIGKRLWGDKAKHAGQPDFQLKTRTFALIYFDTAEGTYKAGADFFEKELKKYGAKLTLRRPVTGAHVDTAGAQQEAPVVSQELKDAGITSVIFAGDPLYPIFLTQEATKDNYFPEWIVTGSVLSDTTLFGRLYDQTQWRHAFGVSALAARFPEEVQESYRVYEWHNGTEPPGDTYGIRYTPFWIAATGIHMAGPKLTPATFRDGLWAYPATGGGPTTEHTSFGRGMWQWDDYLRYDDMTEIWWDPTVSGESEVGLPGTGMYQYVDGGRRYPAGTWPDTEPKVFTRDGAVTMYDEPPPEDKWPDYPSPAEG